MTRGRKAGPGGDSEGWRPDPFRRFEQRWWAGEWTGAVRESHWDPFCGPSPEGTRAWIEGRGGVLLHWHRDRLTVVDRAGAAIAVPVSRCVRTRLLTPGRHGPGQDVDLHLVVELGHEAAGRSSLVQLELEFPSDQRRQLEEFQRLLVERHGSVADSDEPAEAVPAERGTAGWRGAVTRAEPGPVAGPVRTWPEPPGRPAGNDTSDLLTSIVLDRADVPRGSPTPDDTRSPADRPRPEESSPARVARSERSEPPALPRLTFRRVPDSVEWLSFAPRADSQEVREVVTGRPVPAASAAGSGAAAPVDECP